jgi:hypothetical protein
MLETHFTEDTPLAEDTSAYGGLKARCAEEFNDSMTND